MAEKQKSDAPKGDKAKRPKPQHQGGVEPKAKAAKGADKAPREQATEASLAATRRACASTTTRSCARSSIEEFGYKNEMQVPRIDKIVLNMGVGEATADSKKASVAAADLALIAGQKPVITQARKSIAQLQGAREHADRRQGDAAQGAHVRVPRPPGEHRAAARARLPRPEPEELRRPRQLRAGHQGAHRVPGDQLRQGRADLGHGRHRLHDGQDRRRGAGAARGTSTSRSGSNGSDSNADTGET